MEASEILEKRQLFGHISEVASIDKAIKFAESKAEGFCVGFDTFNGTRFVYTDKNGNPIAEIEVPMNISWNVTSNAQHNGEKVIYYACSGVVKIIVDYPTRRHLPVIGYAIDFANQIQEYFGQAGLVVKEL